MTNTPDPRLQPLTDMQLKQLMTNLHPARIESKQGMSYLAAWDVKATLIRVFGFGGFSSEVTESSILKAEQIAQASNANKLNWSITAKATVRLTIHQLGAVYTETAIAGSKQPDFTESADMAIKSAESDALKRAAIFLGTQFGLSLYNDGKPDEIIKAVLAPDQEWSRGARVKRDGDGNIVAPEAPAAAAPGAPASAGASVAHLRGEGVDDEKHQRNMEQLNSALSAHQAQEPQEAQQPYSGPAALDPALSEGAAERGIAAADEDARGNYNS